MMESEEARRLIAAMHKRPILYNSNVESHKDGDSKNLAWVEIAQEVSNSEAPAAVERLKQRWKILRDSYTRVLRTRKSKVLRGITKMKRWKFEREMDFLQPFVASKKQRSCFAKSSHHSTESHNSNDIETDNDYNSFTYDDDEYTNLMDVKQEPQELVPEHEEAILVYEEHVNSVRSPSTAFTAPVAKEKQLLQLRDLDPIDSFFIGIAQTVKRLKPLNQAHVKKSVANIVMDAELWELDANASTSTGSKHATRSFMQ